MESGNLYAVSYALLLWHASSGQCLCLGDKYRGISFKRKTHCFNKNDEIIY